MFLPLFDLCSTPEMPFPQRSHGQVTSDSYRVGKFHLIFQALYISLAVLFLIFPVGSGAVCLSSDTKSLYLQLLHFILAYTYSILILYLCCCNIYHDILPAD